MSTLIAQWRAYWASHGTKVLGFGSAVVGTLEFVDQATVQLISSIPHIGPYLGKGILISSGLMVARRGFTNSHKVPP